jgi:hypothetical protein
VSQAVEADPVDCDASEKRDYITSGRGKDNNVAAIRISVELNFGTNEEKGEQDMYGEHCRSQQMPLPSDKHQLMSQEPKNAGKQRLRHHGEK